LPAKKLDFCAKVGILMVSPKSDKNQFLEGFSNLGAPQAPPPTGSIDKYLAVKTMSRPTLHMFWQKWHLRRIFNVENTFFQKNGVVSSLL